MEAALVLVTFGMNSTELQQREQKSDQHQAIREKEKKAHAILCLSMLQSNFKGKLRVGGDFLTLSVEIS